MIVELITLWAQFMNDISGGNAFLAGTLSLWFLTVVSYLCRNVPRGIFNLCKRNFTTVMTINNGGFSQEQTMYNFIRWIGPKMTHNFSRTLSVESDAFIRENGPDVSLGVGYGIHLFFYKKRLFWLRKQRLESSGSNLEKFEITIGTYGRSHKPFEDILSSFAPKRDENKNSVYRLANNGYWEKFSNIPKRPLQSVAMDSKLKSKIVDQITYFKNNRDWFYQRALAYKLTYILHGMPGTGKTSIIKSIASEFDMNICIININYMSDKLLEVAFSTVPDNSIVIIEDFDSSSITKSRGLVYKNNNADDEKSNSPASMDTLEEPMANSNNNEEFSMLSLTGFLNALDGIVPMDNCIVFMTTNDITKIDPAIYRKGRVDHMIEIGSLKHNEIRKYCEYLFPEYDFSEYQFNETIGCKLHDALLFSKDSPEIFIDHLITNGIAIKKDIYSIQKTKTTTGGI